MMSCCVQCLQLGNSSIDQVYRLFVNTAQVRWCKLEVRLALVKAVF